MPTTTEPGSEMRALVASSRPKYAGLGFPRAVRERVCAHAAERRAQGERLRAIAHDIGLSRFSLAEWLRPGRPATLRRVELVPDVPDAPDSRPPPPARPAPVLVSPRGYRVEGLAVAELGELLREIG